MELTQKEITKRRIMFLTEEDYYYTVYNLLLLLKHLKCISEDKHFTDSSKLAYLVDFVSDNRLTEVLQRNIEHKSRLSPFEKTLFTMSFYRGLERQKILTRILRVMEERKYITVIPNNDKDRLDLYVNESNIPNNFLENSVFDGERQNIINLCAFFSRVRTVSLDNTKQRLFGDSGVDIWHN